MGWAVGYDDNWRRWVGYGVPATCDHPRCGAAIDRGLAYVCGGEPYGGEHGCGLFFCGEHGPQCERCQAGAGPFDPTPDTAEWVSHLLTDESWQDWRDQNPAEVERLRSTLCGLCRGAGDWQEEFIDPAGGVSIRGGVCSVCDGTGLQPPDDRLDSDYAAPNSGQSELP